MNLREQKLKYCSLNFFFRFEITGKSFKGFYKFLELFDEINLSQNCILWTTVSGFNKKFFITVLKSPHINKTAQEQFEYRIYKKKVIISTFQPALFLVIIKILQGCSFPGITLKVTLSEELTLSYEDMSLLDLLDPIYIKLKKNKLKTLIKYKKFMPLKSIKYVQMFDMYGGSIQ